MTSGSCEARQYGDTTMCARCGLQWDANDPEPPRCRPVAAVVDKGYPRGDSEVAIVRKGDKIVTQQISVPGKRLTDDQWKQLREACGEKQ